MGNLALEYAVANWFLNGNGTAMMFDLAILAAGDCRYDAFDQPDLAGLRGLSHLAQRVSTFYSHADQVLHLSMVVNLGAKRLGKMDHITVPPFRRTSFQMVDCSADRDYEFDFLTSHQRSRWNCAGVGERLRYRSTVLIDVAPDARQVVLIGRGKDAA